MAKAALITHKFLKPGDWGKRTTLQKNAIKEFMAKQNPDGCKVSTSLEELLANMNRAKSYNDIPEIVKFSYVDLLRRNIDLKEVCDVVNLTARIAASRFNEKPKEILFTGFAVDQPLGIEDYKKLTSAGFVGCTLSPMIYGIEAAEESANSHKKDPSHWSGLDLIDYKKIITLNALPLEVTLTFRQEQILQLILKGMTNYQIAKRLTLSESTVKMHIGMILKKYGVQDRTRLLFSLKEKIG
jgi:DNA-binding CsgD family transcriptional regulator